MSGRILYTTCQRYFAGAGCSQCPLKDICERQGFVPAGFTSPPADPNQFAQWADQVSVPSPAQTLGQAGEQAT